MTNVWASFEKANGKILSITYGNSSIAVAEDNLYLEIPDELVKQYIINQRPTKIKNDLRIVYKNNEIVDIINIGKNTNNTINGFREIPYFYKNNITNVNLMLVIKSLNYKPVLEITFISGKEILTDPHKNKLLIHLTEKRNIHGHYQSFDIDLRIFLDCESIVFDIDRCDYQKLFNNDISFYYRNSIDLAYTIK